MLNQFNQSIYLANCQLNLPHCATIEKITGETKDEKNDETKEGTKRTWTRAGVGNNPLFESVQWVSGDTDERVHITRVKVDDEMLRRISLFVHLPQLFPPASLQLGGRLRTLVVHS